VVSDETIVRHMGICHQEVPIAQDSLPSSMSRCPVDGDELPDDVVIANNDMGFLTLKFKVLRDFSDGGKLKYLTIFPDRCPPGNNYVGPDPGVFADGYVFADD